MSDKRSLQEVLGILGLVDDNSNMEKAASETEIEKVSEEAIDKFLDLVETRAQEKLAATNDRGEPEDESGKPVATRDASEHEVAKDPEAMLEQTAEEDLTDEEVAEIAEALAENEAAEAEGVAGGTAEAAKETIKNSIVQAGQAIALEAIQELEGSRMDKVASVRNLFGEGTAKARLFEKMASLTFNAMPRVISDESSE